MCIIYLKGSLYIQNNILKFNVNYRNIDASLEF